MCSSISYGSVEWSVGCDPNRQFTRNRNRYKTNYHLNEANLVSFQLVPAAAATGSQIRGVTSPVFHLYLQNYKDQPVLGPESSSGYFIIGSTIQLTSTPPLYLNVGNATTSYKPLFFNTTAAFSGWALEGDTIITGQKSTYGRQLNFLACSTSTSGYYSLYLQTGNDSPSSGCSLQTIHLPCLCWCRNRFFLGSTK